MNTRVFLVLLLFWCFSCQKQIQTQDSLLSHIPQNAIALVKINNLAGFLSELRNNAFLDKSKDLSLLKSISKKADILNHVETNSNSLLGVYELGKDNFEIMWVMRGDSNSVRIDEGTEKKIETLTYDNNTLTKYQIEDYEVFSTERDGYTLFSSSQMLLENLIRVKGSLTVDQDVQKLYDTASKEKSASFFFNLKTENPLLNQSSVDQNKGNFAEWMSLDFSSNQNSSSFNGLAVVSDSTKIMLVYLMEPILCPKKPLNMPH